MSYVRRNVVVGAPVSQTFESDNRSVVWSRRISPVSILSIVAGALLVIVGAVALLRSDLHGSLSDPMVKVAGLTHTPLLGLIEIGIGIILMLGGADRSRSTVVFMGSALVVFGIILVIQSESLRDELGVTAAHGWWAIVIGAALLIGAAMLPTFTRSHVIDTAARVTDGNVLVERPVYAPPVPAYAPPVVVAEPTVVAAEPVVSVPQVVTVPNVPPPPAYIERPEAVVVERVEQ